MSDVVNLVSPAGSKVTVPSGLVGKLTAQGYKKPAPVKPAGKKPAAKK